MEKIEVREVLSHELSQKTGICFCAEQICTDETNWHGYLPSRSLKNKHPLILRHQGDIFAIIPVSDFGEMVKGRISVNNYINESFWHYGYCQNDGRLPNDLPNSIFWQQLEKGAGIRDAAKISEYFETLNPYPQGLSRKRQDACKILSDLVKARVEKHFAGLQVIRIAEHDGSSGIVIQRCYFGKNLVIAFLPRQEIIKKLYSHSQARSRLQKCVDEWDFSVLIPYHIGNDGSPVKKRLIPLPESDKGIESLQEIWNRIDPPVKKTTIVDVGPTKWSLVRDRIKALLSRVLTNPRP